MTSPRLGALPSGAPPAHIPSEVALRVIPFQSGHLATAHGHRSGQGGLRPIPPLSPLLPHLLMLTAFRGPII